MPQIILIITNKRDGHIDSVVSHLDGVAQPWIRLNTEDVPENLRLTINPSQAKGAAIVLDSERSFRLEDISAVWYRKPDPLNLSHFTLETASLDYVEAEFSEILQGLYSLLHKAFWINNPFSCRIAHRKMLQLNVASQVGLITPRSVITNESDVDFCLRGKRRMGYSD